MEEKIKKFLEEEYNKYKNIINKIVINQQLPSYQLQKDCYNDVFPPPIILSQNLFK